MGDTVVIITANGDLILEIEDTLTKVGICYRVSSTVLKKSSTYFVNLLDPQKFSEGVRVHRELAELRTKHSDISVVPTSLLPRVLISDVGDFPRGISNEFILTYFFKILHLTNERPHRNPSSTSMALLAVVADRFDAAKSIVSYVKEAKAPHNQVTKEETWRQKVLTGYLLNIDDSAKRLSNQLILAGSEKWTQEKQDSVTYGEPLWWHLPGDIEEELAYRRECILATISSLQNHFLDLYLSKQRQCKKGYESSPQCDSFQLGQMIRFFSKQGTLRLQSKIIDFEDYQPYSGHVEELITTLRGCPEYQIDENHTHCGLRTRFLPPLEYIQIMLSSCGLCMRCWKYDRQRYSWLQSPTGETWTFRGSRASADRRKSYADCEAYHYPAKDMFTSDNREWTPVVDSS